MATITPRGVFLILADEILADEILSDEILIDEILIDETADGPAPRAGRPGCG